MNLHLIYFTAGGYALSQEIEAILPSHHSLQSYTGSHKQEGVYRSLAQFSAQGFEEGDALLFLSATGIALRGIAPHIQSKLTDPAVLVLDEGGQFVIPLLSGHWGGANALAEELATLLHRIPVITTATDQYGLFAVDTFAKEENMVLTSPHYIKDVSGNLLRGKKARLYTPYPILSLPPEIQQTPAPQDCDFAIAPLPLPDRLTLLPRNLILGIGCRKGIAFATVLAFVEEFLQKYQRSPLSLKGIASVDVKKEETALLTLAQQWNLPFRCYPPTVLAEIEGTFESSPFVLSQIGVDNVCQRSAVALGRELDSQCRLLTPKETHPLYQGVTLALAEIPVTLSLQRKHT